MTAVTLLTSIYGDYDAPVPPVRQDIDCDYLLISDRRYDCPPWRTTVRPVADEVEARHAARYPKFLPDLFTDTEIVAWVDGRVVITSPAFVSWLIDGLGGADIAVWRHETRTSTRAEAQAAAREMPMKYTASDLLAHADEHLGEPDDDLWALTIMVTRPSDRTARMGADVLEAMRRWPRSIDQIEFPHAARRHGVKIADLPGSRWDHHGRLFHFRPHADGT